MSAVSVSVVFVGRPGGRGLKTWPCVGPPGYSLFRTRIAANSTTALDKIRIALATSWSKVAGGHTLGFCGHLTTITGGWWLPGSTNSMVMVWPFRMPLDSGVMDDWDKADSYSV